jgi:hypothetical protein
LSILTFKERSSTEKLNYLINDEFTALGWKSAIGISEIGKLKKDWDKCNSRAILAVKIIR